METKQARNKYKEILDQQINYNKQLKKLVGNMTN